MIYWQNGKYKEALQEFSAAPRIDPSYSAPVLKIGDILNIIGKKELKNKIYESYLLKNSQDQRLFEELSNIITNN